MLRQARQAAGLTQEELARQLKTKKTAISRIEKHAEDIKLSTLERVAGALGKRLQIRHARGHVYQQGAYRCSPLRFLNRKTPED